MEAASPIEASFWPIHPTLDRLLQYKDMVKPFTTKEWAAEGDDVCVYYERPVADPDDDGVETNCEGHHAYDLTYFKAVLSNADGKFDSKHMTNIEMRDAMDPRDSYSLPYMYNHFDWTHCDEIGIVFKDVAHVRD